MVHDPRVTLQLSRLGGLYRDPARVDRDAASLLKSSVGSHLQPIASEMVEDNGNTSLALVLQGTFSIHFRANTYQLLTDIYLPAGYPNRPPVAFVRLAENMYLKENHRHVGADGKVYLPYLHEWNAATHNLVELVVAMSSVFSADPPVFTRAPTATAAPVVSASASAIATSRTSEAPPPPFSHAISSSTNSNASNNNSKTAVTRRDSFSSGVPSWQRDAEDILAAEAAEANAAADAARTAERERKAQLQAAADMSAWEQARLFSIRDQVAVKMHKALQESCTVTQQQVQQDWRDQQNLELAEKDKLNVQLAFVKKHQKQLLSATDKVETQHVALQEWLDDAATAMDTTATAAENGQNGGGNDVNGTTAGTAVDDMVLPATALNGQMLDLAAENAAISDALYFLDRGLYKGHLDCEAHLRQVRRLAKRQFLVRAHLIKIHQAVC
jgi:hypothetical protein